MNTEVGLKVSGLSHAYRGRRALSQVTFTVPAIGVTALLGPNGAGKSTLMRILAGVEALQEGQIEWRSTPLRKESEWRPYKRVVGWLPQNFGYSARATVTDFLMYAAWLKEVPPAAMKLQVSEVLAAVDLESEAKTQLGSLSGGMLRRAGLAQALVNRPRIVLLDEPTVGLDPQQRDDLHRTLSAVRSEASIILSTHLLDDVAVLADAIALMNRGSMLFSGSMDDFVETEQGDRAQGVRNAFNRFLQGTD